MTFDPVAEKPDADLASAIVWFDAYVTNVDRTPRNTNMLVWHRRLWLIDHGAALYFHHTWNNYRERSRDPFPMIKDHVLLQFASSLQEVDAKMTGRVTPDIIDSIVKLIPDAWLVGDSVVRREQPTPGRLHGVPAEPARATACFPGGGDPCTITIRMITL